MTFGIWRREVSLYVGGNKPGPCPKGYRGKLVQVIYHKAGGAADGEKNIMLMRQMEEEWTHIVLNTWSSKTISGCLEDEVGGNQVHMGTFAPIKYTFFWKGKKAVINWGLLPVGGKLEPWVIALNVLLESGYVRLHLLNKERFHLWY